MNSNPIPPIPHIQGNPVEAKNPWSELFDFLAGQRPFLSLILFTGLLYLPWLGTAPVRGTLEGNRLEASREMLHSGDWVVPTLNGRPYLAKPPFQYWIIATISYPWGEVTAWSGRLLSVVSLIGLVCLVAWWGREELGLRTGYFAAIMVASSGLILEKVVKAELEGLLAFLTALSMFAFWKAVEGNTRRGVALVVSGLALGAAVLTKGPVAPLVLAATAFTVFLSGDRERRRVCVTALATLGVAILLVLPWALALWSRVGAEAIFNTLNRQVVHRIQAAGQTNVEPFWFYLPSVLGGLLPWSVLIPGLWLLRRPSHLVDERNRRHWFFLVGWSVGSLLLFSFSSGKETRYLMPTYSAWCLLLAWGWLQTERPDWLMRYERFLKTFVYWGTWILPFAGLVAGWFVEPGSRVWAIAASLLLLAARVLFSWGFRVQHKAALLVALLLAVFAAKAFWGEVYLAHRTQRYPLAQFGSEVASLLKPGEDLLLLGGYRSYIQFAIGHPFVLVDDMASLREGIASGKFSGMRLLVITRGHATRNEGNLKTVLQQAIGSYTYRLFYIPERTD